MLVSTALESLALPDHILPEIIPTGTRIGTLDESLCEELGLEPAEVIAVAGHDTQSAMVAVPTEQQEFLFFLRDMVTARYRAC